MASIIIPAHNEENYIEKTLEAVGDKQEVIVVCNGCTDKTFQVASKYNCKVFNIKDKGVSMARNFGARQSTSDPLVFLDADIIVDKDTLDKIKDSDYDIGVTKVKPDVDKVLPKVLMSLKTKAHTLYGCSSGLIFCTKQIFDKIGGFDESLELGEDGKFLRAARKIGNFGMVDAYVYNSMRRLEKVGYPKIIWFWIKHYFLKRKKYEVIR